MRNYLTVREKNGEKRRGRERRDTQEEKKRRKGREEGLNLVSGLG